METSGVLRVNVKALHATPTSVTNELFEDVSLKFSSGKAITLGQHICKLESFGTLLGMRCPHNTRHSTKRVHALPEDDIAAS